LGEQEISASPFPLAFEPCPGVCHLAREVVTRWLRQLLALRLGQVLERDQVRALDPTRGIEVEVCAENPGVSAVER
jgi:hypothetical protein